MLGKLIKYEFKATTQIFLLTYAVVVVLAGINALILAMKPATGSGADVLYAGASSIMTLLFGTAAFAAFLLTIVIIIVRFYRMLGDEGYLWFTLPVTPAQQIFGKLIPAVVWTVTTTIVTLASVGLATLHLKWFSQLGATWRALVAQRAHPGVWLVCFFVFMLASLLVNTMVFYTSMSWGPNLIKSSRLGGSVVAYIICYCGLEAVNLAGFLIMAKLFFDAVDALPSSHGTTLPDLTPQDWAAFNHVGAIFGSYFAVEYLVLAVVCFIITRYFLTRKLNLA